MVENKMIVNSPISLGELIDKISILKIKKKNITDKEKLSFILNCDFEKIAPIAFEQHLFHLDCNFLRQESWRGSILTTFEICNKYSPQELRNARNKISHFSDAGWSFSSFGGPEAIKEKFKAFAHKEYNSDEFTNSKHITNCQKTIDITITAIIIKICLKLICILHPIINFQSTFSLFHLIFECETLDIP